MPSIGILGGMGPAATVDFLGKLVALTPAHCDQEHLPVVVSSLPQVPDRSRAILGQGPDPLPALLRGIRLLNQAGAGLIAIPCNSSHHWYDAMAAASGVPVLHIARTCVQALPSGGRACVLATRGALASGFYQRALAEHGVQAEVPDPETEQPWVDECIRAIKAGAMAAGGQALDLMLARARERGAHSIIMGCTEIPLAMLYAHPEGLHLVDSSLELARACVQHGLAERWNQA